MLFRRNWLLITSSGEPQRCAIAGAIARERKRRPPPSRTSPNAAPYLHEAKLLLARRAQRRAARAQGATSRSSSLCNSCLDGLAGLGRRARAPSAKGSLIGFQADSIARWIPARP